MNDLEMLDTVEHSIQHRIAHAFDFCVTIHSIPRFQIAFKTDCGQYDLEVTTFQLSVLFSWNLRPREAITFENLKLATQLPEAELRKTLWVSGWCFLLLCTDGELLGRYLLWHRKGYNASCALRKGNL